MELVELAEQVELEEAASRASGTYGNNRQEHTCLRLSFQPLKQQLEKVCIFLKLSDAKLSYAKLSCAKPS